ncbi:MAG: DMT family transporter [Paracoccaceae bacterium]
MRLNDNLLGAALMTCCVLAYVLNDAVMKLLFADIDFFQAIFLRGLVSLPPILIMALMTKMLLQKYSAKNQRLMIIRILAEIGTTVTFLTALKHMPLANVTAILQSLPLAITMAAAIFLGEPVGWRRWSAICVGFTGVLIIIRPGLAGFNSYSLLALAAVILLTVREISTRQLDNKVPTVTVALSTTLGITAFAALMLIGTEWAEINFVSWSLIIAAAAAVTVATLLSVVAMRTGDIGFVSPFRYTSLIGAIGLGILLFGEWPDGVTLLGAAIIAFAGIYSLYREQIFNKNV